MALPMMNSDATAFDRVPSAQPVTPATTVAEARAHLHATGEPAAVVYQAGRPFGVVTAGAVARAMAGGHADAPISSVLDHIVVPVRPGTDARDTVETFTKAAWTWLRRRPRSCAP